MPISLLHYAFLFFELILSFWLAAYAISMLYSYLRGVPYVSTKNINDILKQAKLKSGQTFLELGCGDGRVVRTAVQKYGVHGTGIDINPTLIWLAKLRTRFSGLNTISFFKQNVYNTDLSQADVIYLFLFPQVIDKLKENFKKTKKNVLIMSHGFKIPYMEKDLIYILEQKPFMTYYYKKRD